ncbi:MAG: nitroreductase family protein [Bryobacteraceae bacterium]|nr:nitroreductase family protein [Bryobacteraceae bacterium]
MSSAIITSPLDREKGRAASLELPAPRMTGGRPLMEALRHRHSARAFNPDPLPAQVLSDLLWAACGVNRPETGNRTAPSACNWQEIDVYVALSGGLYLYAPAGHRLECVVAADIRAATGEQDFVRDAPVNLIYVADLARMVDADDGRKTFYSISDAAFISQNVYLFCASEGLATVVRGSLDRRLLAHRIGLRPQQRVILAQSVGYPADGRD